VTPESSSPRPAPDRSHPARLQVLPGRGSDAELLDLVLSGAVDAPARLHERFARDLNRVVWKLLGADHEHDDLVHDVFLKVWTLMARGKVRQPERVANWVVAVAVNTVHKELRRRRVRRRFLGATPRTEPVTTTDHAEARNLLGAVYAILDQIVPDDRLAFSLRYLDQRHLTEVAELCHCSLATAKRRIARAERRFSALAGATPAVVALLAGCRWGETP
jgi:RNA polymerase sigma-70 factor, ECF subfamily